MAPGNRLSTKQNKAIAALLTEPTREEAAKKAGVIARTIRRWLADSEDFRQALAAAEVDLIANAARSIAAGSNEAVAVLRDIMLDEDNTTRTRRAAASSLLSHLPPVRLLGSLEAAIARLQQGDDAKS
jgi:hypothetical protein